MKCVQCTFMLNIISVSSLKEFVDRWRYNAKRASQAQMRLKILEKL